MSYFFVKKIGIDLVNVYFRTVTRSKLKIQPKNIAVKKMGEIK